METQNLTPQPAGGRCGHGHSHRGFRFSRALFIIGVAAAAGFAGGYAGKSFAHGPHGTMSAPLDPAQMEANLAAMLDTLAQKHLSVWNYVNDPLVFAAGKQVMAQFTAADQALVRACALEAGRYEIGVTRKGLGEGGDRSSFDELAKRGVEATILTDAEKRAFATATRPVFDKWAATIGRELVARAEAVIRAAS